MSENRRQEILKKITELESLGIFDQDVEDDPESYELFPDDIDYLHEKLSTKIKTFITLKLGERFFKKQEKCGNLIIKEINGIENLPDKSQGAIITCNHFHPFDNYIVLRGIKKTLKHGRFYKVIREGNYTNPPKGFEAFMRYGDTLPLSRNIKTMKKFFNAISVLLKKGKKILVYPEQAMWWNYRKPRPLKSGAFNFAVTNKVPVIPVFITMKHSGKVDADGADIEEYTVNICPTIYPDENLSNKENAQKMSKENYDAWVEVYQRAYNEKLVYNTKEE